MRKSSFVSLVIFLVIFAYAVVRYNVIKGVPWAELPLLISNKAIALSAIVFIALSYILGSLARFFPRVFVSTLSTRKFFGLLGFGLAALHGFISLLIFTPAHYPKFFLASGKLNLTGELSMLFGVLAFFVFMIVALASVPSITKSMDTGRWLAIQRFGYCGLILTFFHVLTMGFEGWLVPSGWPGGLLPISLIAALVVMLALLLKITVLFFPGKGNKHISH